MLMTIALILAVLWLFGFIALPAAGALIHLILVVAVIIGILHLLGYGGRAASTL